tara:strand:- start:13482 stop:14804 length:1323 start_codon:yes stop_codon:yes gene_type:complete
MIDFYIEKINFEFENHGNCNLEIHWNGNKIQNNVISDIQKDNKLELFFSKNDPSDKDSYSTLKYFKINDGNFTDWFKQIEYKVDVSKHSDVETIIVNNGYYGYIGQLEINISQCDLLKKAAWLIADRHFKNYKTNSRERAFREKTFDNVHDDARWMFTGSWPPDTKEIVDHIDNLTIKQTKPPVILEDLRKQTEEWLQKSNRISFKNFDKFEHFCFDKGILSFINSFLMRQKEVYKPNKIYQFVGEISEGKDITYKDIFGEIKEKSVVYLELPSPWYDNDRLLQVVKEAKEKNCYIVVDLVWCPIARNNIDIDLDLFDEVFFSMNKAWPINHLRPAIRWSKKHINDISTFTNTWGYYPVVEANVFLNCIKKFSYDFTFRKYSKDADSILDTFGLKPTEVLWFAEHDTVNHNDDNYISKHYFLDDRVCILNLLQHKGKYFW